MVLHFPLLRLGTDIYIYSPAVQQVYIFKSISALHSYSDRAT